jgi:hypothetical protein
MKYLTLFLIISVHYAFADENKWTELTTEQIASHLKIDGGNIKFNFEYPVTLKFITEYKNGNKDAEIKSFRESEAGKKFTLSILVDSSEKNYILRSINYKYLNHTSGGGAGYTYNLGDFNKKLNPYRHGGTWNNLHLTPTVGKKILLYEYREDSDDPKYYFYLYAYFSKVNP